jgi:hypothetical protein
MAPPPWPCEPCHPCPSDNLLYYREHVPEPELIRWIKPGKVEAKVHGNRTSP